jgi:hypothetical protein
MSTDAELLLAMMRAAEARLRCAAFDIEEVELTLKAGRVSPAGAVAWLRMNGVADLVLHEGSAFNLNEVAA